MAIKKNTPVPEIVSAYVSNDSSLGTEQLRNNKTYDTIQGQ